MVHDEVRIQRALRQEGDQSDVGLMTSEDNMIGITLQSECPSCGQENHCQNISISSKEDGAQQTKSQSNCWCMSVSLSPEQQVEVDKYGDKSCCLCAQCIDSFKKLQISPDKINSPKSYK